MKNVLLILIIALSVSAQATVISPRIDYSESHYKSAPASDTDCSTGSVIPSSQKIVVHTIRANGVSDTTVIIVFDKDGGSEKIFTATTGDIDLSLDSTDTNNQITGDGTKKLQVCIINDRTVPSPIVGGAYEAVKIQ